MNAGTQVLRLRVAADTDLRSVATIHHRSTHAGYSAFLPPQILETITIESRLPRWQERFADEHHIIIASDGECDIGFAYVIDSPEFRVREQDDPELSHLFVVPEYWNRGVGRALCEAACTHVRENGAVRLLIWTFTANEQARSAYERWGFELDGVTRQYEYEGGVFPQVRFAKNL